MALPVVALQPPAAGHPTPSQTRYDVLREVLLLLTDANVTPAQRAALIGVLGE